MENLYCPTCEIKIAGNYCSECGTKGVPETGAELVAAANWRAEKDLGKLVKNPAVQAFIKSHLAESKKALSAEEFLKGIDLLFAPVSGLSLKKLADVVVPIYTKLGLKTGKSKTEHFDYSIQEVVVKLLCSMVKRNYPLKEVHEVHTGIVLISGIPSSMKTFGGETIISVEESENSTRVNIAAKIKGQLYDWGESKSVIKKLFSDIEQIDLDLV